MAGFRRERAIVRWLAIAIIGGAALVSGLASCSSDDAPPAPPPPSPKMYDLSRADLMDPDQCGACHTDHYREWSGSMHAYAAEDPVFLAMNARGQRETKGQLGSFCVQCHAPIALRTGATTDGLNLPTLAKPLKGITCFFCHSTDSVTGTHNNALHLADDGVLRASLANPLENSAHPTSYSALHDRERIDSSQLCGGCHDVQNQAGLDLEKTFAEWKGALYAHDVAGQRLTCGGCHMPGYDGKAADLPDAPARRVHDHSMAGVDVAMTPFAETAAQRSLVQQNLDPALVAKLCVKPPQAGDNVEVTLDNAFVGHAWPSGAAQDRRAWLELVAYAGAQVVFQTGVVADGQSVTALDLAKTWLLRETMTDDADKEVLMMWQARKATEILLPPAVTSDPKDPAFYHAVTRTFAVPPSADRITMRVRFIPIGYDVLDDLIASGDLDPSLRAKMPVFTLSGTALEWASARGFNCVP